MLGHNNNKKTLLFLTSAVSLLAFLLVPTKAMAGMEISISGNGEGSDSSVDMKVEKEVSVVQENEVEVDNDVDVDLNTGENEASGNTGEVQVETGNIGSTVEIENSNISSSQVNMECPCPQESIVQIEGNGKGSVNDIDLDLAYKGDVTITQTANITTLVNGKANTGFNSADRNGGDVLIQTGNIDASERIKNQGVNTHGVTLPYGGLVSDLKVGVLGNGTDSRSTVTAGITGDLTIFVSQKAKIDNKSLWDLNTGRNSADDNLGNVVIRSGDINFDAKIENSGINSGWVRLVGCCDENGDPGVGGPGPDDPGDKGTPPATTPSQKVSPTNGGDDKKKDDDDDDDDDDDNGSVLGATFGGILPATGTNWLLLATLANVLMFLLGAYLRLRSGRAPAYAYLPA